MSERFEDDFLSAQMAFLSPAALDKVKRAIPPARTKDAVRLIFENTVMEDEFHLMERNGDLVQLLEECFERLCKCQTPDSCRFCCLDPENHFNDGCCAPIKTVLQRLQSVKYDIWDILDDDDQNHVLRNLHNDHPSKSWIVREMDFPNKYNVFLWPNYTGLPSDLHEQVLPAWITLRENLICNFTVLMPPANKCDDDWKHYVMIQMEQSDAIIVAPSPTLFEELGTPGRHPDLDDETQFMISLIKGDLMPRRTDQLSNPTALHTTTELKKSYPNTLRVLLPPPVLALTDPNLDLAYCYSPFVFDIPRDIPQLLVLVYHLIEINNKARLQLVP